MTAQLLSIRHYSQTPPSTSSASFYTSLFDLPDPQPRPSRPRPGTYRYSLAYPLINFKVLPTFRYFIRGKNARPADEDYVVDMGRKPRLKLYDKHLKAFNFKKALSAALEVTTNSVPLKNSSVLSFIVFALLLCPITCSLCR